MSDQEPRVTVRPDGPYVVSGSIPLRNKEPIVSEHGEPLGWLTGAGTDQAAAYALCRCGSGEMTAEASDGSYTTRYRFTRLADMP